ncbi:SDR family oxidoreductase [Asticcacaulis sp. 201]|uniref:SDR family oxidoreductase n=1 Tax=Asticcacaulis sp. 201 TaxID=3028787 RepID=UPI0029164C93|nr:SDR family oxidoreductase [Asticcacaulis sp. 201]MDV6329246.1 SDR family oxidoreductase [Asticcacaulis sp. 201]
MDLGIKGRYAIVCASSQGLGRACATELARAGCVVVINGRDAEKLNAVAEELREETGAQIIAIAGDVASPETQAALMGAVPQVDILVNNNGGPPYRDFRQIDRAAMIDGVTNNMVTPIEMVQRVIDGMVARQFGRIVNITSASVKMPLSGLDLSSGARVGLTGFLAGVARSVAHANVTINFLLPGSFDTNRQLTGLAAKAQQQGVAIGVVRAESEERIPAKRFGEPSEFGAACAFLCSAQAGYITGQSLLIDGGAYPGVL